MALKADGGEPRCGRSRGSVLCLNFCRSTQRKQRSGDGELGAAGAPMGVSPKRENQDEGVVRESLNKVGKGKEGDTGPAGDG